jgi:hypothetical protein
MQGVGGAGVGSTGGLVSCEQVSDSIVQYQVRVGWGSIIFLVRGIRMRERANRRSGGGGLVLTEDSQLFVVDHSLLRCYYFSRVIESQLIHSHSSPSSEECSIARKNGLQRRHKK